LFASDVSITGDVRVRHQVTDDSATTNQATGQQVRARLNAVATLSGNTSVGVGLATGSTNARSTNQALGGTFSSKSINLDTAYIKTQVLGSDVTLGKFANPFVTESELFWDNDIRTEGVVVGSTVGPFTLSSGYLLLQDNANNDPTLLVGQLGLDTAYVTLAGSYTTTKDVAVKETYINLNGHVYGSIFGLDITSFGEYNTNTEATSDDTAWLVGVRTSYKGVALGYAYREVQANAVNALLTDSDFGNGADTKGSEVNVSCLLNNDVKLGVTYFDLTNGLTNGTDYDRLQVDLSVKF
jgi:hypothetical protein